MNIEPIVDKIKTKNMWLPNILFIWGSIYCLAHYIGGKVLYLIQETVLPFIALIMLIYFSEKIEKNIEYKYNVINFVYIAASYGLGIYLWAEPLNYLVLHVCKLYFGIAFFGTEAGAFFVILFRMLGTPMVAILITFILKKIRFPIKAY